GILKVSADGKVIDPLDNTSVVADRVFFMGLDGSFSIAGIAGIRIQLAFTELGPLGVLLSVSTPQGILIHPPTGLTINDFTASVEFFRSLASITDPFALRGESFLSPTDVKPETWLDTVQKQVTEQVKRVREHPELNGFT